MSEVFRQFRIEPQMFAGDRVHKAKRFCVQALAVQAGDAIVRPYTGSPATGCWMDAMCTRI